MTWLQTPRWAPSELGTRARTSAPGTLSNLSKGTAAPSDVGLRPLGAADWVWTGSDYVTQGQRFHQNLEAVVALVLLDHREAHLIGCGQEATGSSSGLPPTCAPGRAVPPVQHQGSMEFVPGIQS